jgi:hypothetical protein
LVICRIYEVRHDPNAERRGLLRVVDESGEDYLFPKKLFAAIELPKETARIVGGDARPANSSLNPDAPQGGGPVSQSVRQRWSRSNNQAS